MLEKDGPRELPGQILAKRIINREVSARRRIIPGSPEGTSILGLFEELRGQERGARKEFYGHSNGVARLPVIADVMSSLKDLSLIYEDRPEGSLEEGEGYTLSKVEERLIIAVNIPEVFPRLSDPQSQTVWERTKRRFSKREQQLPESSESIPGNTYEIKLVHVFGTSGGVVFENEQGEEILAYRSYPREVTFNGRKVPGFEYEAYMIDPDGWTDCMTPRVTIVEISK